MFSTPSLLLYMMMPSVNFVQYSVSARNASLVNKLKHHLCWKQWTSGLEVPKRGRARMASQSKCDIGLTASLPFLHDRSEVATIDFQAAIFPTRFALWHAVVPRRCLNWGRLVWLPLQPANGLETGPKPPHPK